MTKNEAKGRLESFIDTFNICKEHDNSLVAVSIGKEDIQAFTMAIKSLEAWDKVEERIQRYRSENTNTGDMFLAGCGDGAYHVLCMIHEELRGDTNVFNK